jgi:hypothetical protein
MGGRLVCCATLRNKRARVGRRSALLLCQSGTERRGSEASYYYCTARDRSQIGPSRRGFRQPNAKASPPAGPTASAEREIARAKAAKEGGLLSHRRRQKGERPHRRFRAGGGGGAVDERRRKSTRARAVGGAACQGKRKSGARAHERTPTPSSIRCCLPRQGEGRGAPVAGPETCRPHEEALERTGGDRTDGASPTRGAKATAAPATTPQALALPSHGFTLT